MVSEGQLLLSEAASGRGRGVGTRLTWKGSDLRELEHSETKSAGGWGVGGQGTEHSGEWRGEAGKGPRAL